MFSIVLPTYLNFRRYINTFLQLLGETFFRTFKNAEVNMMQSLGFCSYGLKKINVGISKPMEDGGLLHKAQTCTYGAVIVTAVLLSLTGAA